MFLLGSFFKVVLDQRENAKSTREKRDENRRRAPDERCRTASGHNKSIARRIFSETEELQQKHYNFTKARYAARFGKFFPHSAAHSRPLNLERVVSASRNRRAREV